MKFARKFIEEFVTHFKKWESNSKRERPPSPVPNVQSFFNEYEEAARNALLSTDDIKQHSVLTLIIGGAERYNFEPHRYLFTFFMGRPELEDLYLYSRPGSGNHRTALFQDLQHLDSNDLKRMWLRFLATNYPTEVAKLMTREALGAVESDILDAILNESPPPSKIVALLFPPSESSGGLDSHTLASNVMESLLHRASKYDPRADERDRERWPEPPAEEWDSEDSEGSDEEDNEWSTEDDEDEDDDSISFKKDEGYVIEGDMEDEAEDRFSDIDDEGEFEESSEINLIVPDKPELQSATEPIEPEPGLEYGSQRDVVEAVFNWMPQAITKTTPTGDEFESPYQSRVYSYIQYLRMLPESTGKSTEALQNEAIKWADSDPIAHFLKYQVIRRCSTDTATALLHIKRTKGERRQLVHWH